MITPAQLAIAFERNTSIVKKQTDGLTHGDSLLQPPYYGSEPGDVPPNCLNWVMGHMVAYRDSILALFGVPPVAGQASTRYGHGSEPVIGDGEDVMQFDELLRLWEAAGQRIHAALEDSSPADMAREVVRGDTKTTVGERLFFLYFHETFHTGQMEYLRQLAGKHDRII